MTMEEMIADIVAKKTGNKSFLLVYEGGEWTAAIGNRSSHVGIGEAISYGNNYVAYHAEAPIASEAVRLLWEMLS